MRKMDLFWRSNREWWEYKDHIPTIKPDAPPEAQESYKNYIIQSSALHIVDCMKTGDYMLLTLEDNPPEYRFNKYRINGVIYDPVIVYDISDKVIAIKTTESDMVHRLVEFIEEECIPNGEKDRPLPAQIENPTPEDWDRYNDLLKKIWQIDF